MIVIQQIFIKFLQYIIITDFTFSSILYLQSNEIILKIP